ncbi:lycopene cyclase domain-containing protein [Microcella daejeonensis]|uniref:Lycopene cyclase domain-containing protein n=1 Tax=Microcella daejeonensis TaxID=2994971 RepID=A0A9E8SC67_9MICO|nr:lycopene cyclase domain-containing protein [Microcella daejeonensis]WAB82267.1 lycopene cyclase domain-containing protein [Microcella daejeonensis]
MTYTLLNLVFLAAVALVALAAVLARRSPNWRAVGAAAVLLLTLTAIFDNVIIGTGLVDYDEALISGVRVGLAPIEDFAYTVAALVLLPAVWELLPRRRTRDDGSP